MHTRTYYRFMLIMSSLCILLLITACQTIGVIQQTKAQEQTKAITPIPSPTATFASRIIQPTPTVTPKPSPTATPMPTVQTGITGYSNSNHPVLAFYYPWYSTTTWCSCHMSDLPTIQYNSSDNTTISRQLNWAMQAGITGFISSWWGAGDQTDQNLAKMLALTPTIEQGTGVHFASSIYFESDAPALQGQSAIISSLRYVLSRYASSPYFFHWNSKPVIFFWDPLGSGRTLAEWAAIRSQVDPNNQTIWSAEGVDMNLLSVFDGIHLFSAAYWGILDGNINAADQKFRTEIDAYNQANHTHKIWAAGVLPGYNDTVIPGRTGTYIVARNNGTTYRASWNGAIASTPDWITITSFNEWFEGSMIEPSVTYGTLYLNITQQFTRQW